MFVANYALLRHRGLNRATSYLVCLWAWWSTQYTIICLHWNNLQYIHASINLNRYCLCPKYTILFCFCFVKIVCVLNFLSTVSFYIWICIISDGGVSTMVHISIYCAQVALFCREVCQKLECCPYLFGPQLVGAECPSACITRPKHEFLLEPDKVRPITLILLLTPAKYNFRLPLGDQQLLFTDPAAFLMRIRKK